MRGGYLHNEILVDPLDSAWLGACAKTWREVAIRDDCGNNTGYVDLMARLGPWTIAMEVELSAKRIGRDLVKAAGLAVTELWIVVPDVRVRRSVYRKLRCQDPVLDGNRIFVLTLGQARERVQNYFSLFSCLNG